MKIDTKLFYIIILLLSSFFSFAQENREQKERIDKIAKALDEYFLLERENIHLHLNKDVFITNESIWFKGYILNRKSNTPFILTTNVFVILLDESGRKIDEKLIFASNGTFFGNINVNKELASGTYFIQVYTNWMNNFSEDESYLQKITIVNKSNPSISNANINTYQSPNINFFPEGGTFVYGISNTVGIKVLDCNNNPFPINEIDLLDSKNQFIKKIFLNKWGDGKFDVVASNEAYKVVFQVNDNTIEKQLPLPSQKGIALDINSYNVSNRTVIKIKTNRTFVDLNDDKAFLLLIHQDDKATFLEFDLNNKLEHEIVISDDDLQTGVNTIRIIDNELNEIAQRLVFKYPKNFFKSDINTYNINNSIKVLGNLNTPNSFISISVLPENSIATNQMQNIYGSFLLKPYINTININSNYYFNEVTRGKRYELDLFLLNQASSKYNWNSILNNPPKSNYEFDYGLSIAGKIDQKLNDTKMHKLRLKSYRYKILDVVDLDDKNEFVFNNMVLPDSANVDFTLLKMPQLESVKFKHFTRVINGKREFNKIYKPLNIFCEKEISTQTDRISYEIPRVNDEIIYLKDVEIVNTNELKRQNHFGNKNLRGYKVPKNTPMEVLSYIEQNGFKVSRETGGIMITERNASSINAAPSTPVIYIDNIRIISYEQLWGMRMDELDEIYINTTILVPCMTNNRGIIKMYRKEPSFVAPQTDSQTFIVKNGFSKNQDFKNISYSSFTGKGFENFAIINWVPNILPNENTGEFNFTIPDMNQKKVKLKIEGFTSDGKIICEEKIITIP